MERVMSFETVITISAITEFIVLSAISLTLINAFSHGALARYVFGNKQRPAVDSETVETAEIIEIKEFVYRRAA
jgi:hypothetical protein